METRSACGTAVGLVRVVVVIGRQRFEEAIKGGRAGIKEFQRKGGIFIDAGSRPGLVGGIQRGEHAETRRQIGIEDVQRRQRLVP